MTASVIYKGMLRCEAKHIQSGSMLETDAPTDNRGRGERFSPTDLLCVSLATCIVTTMGIKAADMKIDLSETTLEVIKHMLPDPRRIGKIEIKIGFKPGLSITEKDRQALENAGDNCPVMKTLSSGTEVVVEYGWNLT